MYVPNVIETLHQCDALIAAAQAFKDRVRSTGRTYIGDSHAGLSLVNAMFDLTDCDALYELAREIEFDLCRTVNGVGDPDAALYRAVDMAHDARRIA